MNPFSGRGLYPPWKRGTDLTKGRRYATLVERFKATCAEPDPIDQGDMDRFLGRLVARLDAN